MMIFADTFFFIALVSPNDKAHHRASSIIDSLSDKVITTTWVLAELGDGLSHPKMRWVFATVLDFIEQNPLIEVLPPDQQQFTRGVALFRQRKDKAWSLTDCISFIVMNDRGITDALTADHHFEQAGFIPLMK